MAAKVQLLFDLDKEKEKNIYYVGVGQRDRVLDPKVSANMTYSSAVKFIPQWNDRFNR